MTKVVKFIANILLGTGIHTRNDRSNWVLWHTLPESGEIMEFYGCMDNSLSDHLKCIIKQGNVAVIGKLPDGYSSTLQHNWINPFAEDSVGSLFPKSASLLQVVTGRTSKGRLNSYLTWEGSESKVVTIPMFFEAESNADKEVRLPAMYLEQMSSPTFNRSESSIDSVTSRWKGFKAVTNFFMGTSLVGDKVPRMISIKIGKNLILRNCVIESVEKEDPMKYSAEGLPLQMMVTLVIKTRSTLDTSDINNSIG